MPLAKHSFIQLHRNRTLQLSLAVAGWSSPNSSTMTARNVAVRKDQAVYKIRGMGCQ
jgi:hypothetical protein